jgi:leucine dehydrogenase
MIFEKIRSVGTSVSEKFNEFEQVVFCNDSKIGLKAIISVHSTVLGPAVGGCRMWNYATEEEAINDVLRLSRGMTYKAAISGLEWGGGKAVIIGDSKTAKNTAMLQRFGEYVDRLGGCYVTAKDVGIGCADLKTVKSRTSHVLGIDGEANSGGDPSPATAWGVYHGMKSAAKIGLGTDSLKGMTIAIQGLGSVAFSMLEHLMAEGAKVVASDIDQACLERATKKYNIEIVHPDKIYDVPCDIFSPCALGASISVETLSRLQTKVIAGAANNQLATEADGERLLRKGIVYAPDYAINAGGLINIYYESMISGGYNQKAAFERVSKIGQTITDILTRARDERLPSHLVADKMAEERVIAGPKSKA